ncbi:hypothetical protein Ahy_A09g043670 [Arachis hypogaea]|uniref:Zinc finger GRF-type domain-containing protein n=1 Tax=Arachis hypogaea TaxID=3818 RepID=A0A445BIV2_ARAHY|nr:hypothetical protein Ahy_A09g043670 [Arachis hypogaea]
MFGGEGQVSGSSLRSTSNGYRAKTQNHSRATRVLEWCGCGCRPVLRWSGTNSNLNKPFFGCPNHNVNYVGQEAVPTKSESLNYNDEQKMTEGALNPGVGMNLRILPSLATVPELAPCMGLTGAWAEVGEIDDFLFGGSLSDLDLVMVQTSAAYKNCSI